MGLSSANPLTTESTQSSSDEASKEVIIDTDINNNIICSSKANASLSYSMKILKIVNGQR